jgi:SAM-dependent methyltransferase
VLTPERLAELYADSEFLFDEEASYAAETYAKLTTDLLGEDLAQGHLNSLLEIGCSSGFYLEKALALGIQEVLGFEPSRQCHLRANPAVRPFMVQDVFRPELVGQLRFDLAASFHVVDHLFNPMEALRQVAEVLRPGGRLLIVCHDVEAVSARLLRDFSPIFDVEHIYLFSTQTLSRLLMALGLEVERVGPLANTYPLGYWLRMAPLFKHVLPWLPSGLLRKPLTVRAGNLFALARKG